MANASRPAGGAGVRELAPKRSWGKVLFKACILLLMAVVGAHWGWGKYAGARLERELAKYRAVGEPIDPGDFDTPASPDEENAIVDLLAAAELIDWRADVWDRFEAIEECYEFMLAYAARGLASDEGSESGRQLRKFLCRAVEALGGLAASCGSEIREHAAFLAVLDRDAQ